MQFLDPAFLIKTLGAVGIIAIVFAESGLFFGFFLPGDSLLFTAGLVASNGRLDIYTLLIGCALAAILGDSVGYAFGAKVGPKIFIKEESFFFKKRYLDATKNYYDRHGKKTIIMARFIPIVRTFAPILAGVGSMNYRTFLSYNILGGIGWSTLLLLLGYGLGRNIPGIDKYLLPIVLVIIVISILPGVFNFIKISRKKENNQAI